MTFDAIARKADELVRDSLAVAAKYGYLESIEIHRYKIGAELLQPLPVPRTAAYLTFIIDNWDISRWDKSIEANYSADQLWEMLCNSFRTLGLIEAAEASKGEIDYELIEQSIRTQIAKKGAAARIANDPKQTAKAFVRECWNDWQRKPASYKGKSAFAKDMMGKFEELDSQAVITRWCGQWEKEAEK